ncbi:phage portal protein [Bacillus sp. FJAT-50079]|uniref:phage portal protein n=1 Tax=Bacillus sp. FJAT-50079 TaxID=2833577 RepID=UPI001BCA0C17|nr:phage portal protein [Bacillus sp. FJAT-50079]MBS4207454.1 phage portal protein [Bacillus sp. FJAT-50079]
MSINFKDKRHRRYQRMWDLYRNKPQFKKTTGKYIAIPLPAEIAKLFRDLSFKDDISAIIKNNPEASTAIDRLIFDNEFNILLSEMAITVAVKGGAVLKNYLDEGKSRITFIQPEYYFPQLDPFNQRKIVKETIAFPVVEGKDTFLYQEIYEKRNGEYWCITKKSFYNNNEIGADVEVSEVNTYLKESPLTYIPFSRHNGDFFGYSLFFGLEPLFEEYNHRVSQISKILDKHTNPSIVGSVSLLDENYKFVKGENSLFLPVEDGEQKPEYLTWESQLKANFEFLDEVIMKAIHYVSPLNANLYGLTKESANSSALSIKLKAFRTSTVIENSLKYFEQGIKKVLFQAQQLDVLTGAKYTPALPSVEMTASMPNDEYNQMQTEQLKIVSGATSIKSAIARLNPHYTSQEVEEEFLEIINEENERQRLSFMNSESVDIDEIEIDQ